MYISLTTIVVLLFNVWLISWLKEKTDANTQREVRAATKAWQEELACRARLRRRRQARIRAMGSVYWQHSFWQWVLYRGRANNAQPAADREHYMAMVEHQWAEYLLAKEAVIPPPPLPLSLTRMATTPQALASARPPCPPPLRPVVTRETATSA